MTETNLDRLVQNVGFRLGTALSESSIFKKEDVEKAIILGLQAYNETPAFTNFSIESTELIKFATPVELYAAHVLLVRQSLIEKGREWSMQDSGIEYQAPELASFIRLTSHDFLEQWKDRVLMHKDGF